MIRSKNKWPATKNAQRYKLFGELALELVHSKSPENYRYHSLSTPLKLVEVYNVAQKVIQKNLSKRSIDFVLEEANYAIDSDPIIKKILITAGINEPFVIDKNSSIEVIQSRSALILDLISGKYTSTCELEISEICRNGGSPNYLQTVTKLYISNIINSGFNRNYVSQIIESNLFIAEIKRCSTGLLKKLFLKFNSQKRKQFDIYICGRNRYIDFLATIFNMPVFDDISK